MDEVRSIQGEGGISPNITAAVDGGDNPRSGRVGSVFQFIMGGFVIIISGGVADMGIVRGIKPDRGIAALPIEGVIQGGKDPGTGSIGGVDQRIIGIAEITDMNLLVGIDRDIAHRTGGGEGRVYPGSRNIGRVLESRSVPVADVNLPVGVKGDRGVTAAVGDDGRLPGPIDVIGIFQVPLINIQVGNIEVVVGVARHGHLSRTDIRRGGRGYGLPVGCACLCLVGY